MPAEHRALTGPLARRGRRRVALFAVLAVLLTVGGAAAVAADAVVGIADFTFAPVPLTVAAGTTVIFRNADDSPHTVVDDGGQFRSKALDTDDQYAFTFDRPGEFAYHCGLHPYMQGVVIVTP
jgi:plastocyanin